MGNRGVLDYRPLDSLELVPANDEIKTQAISVTTTVQKLIPDPPGPIDLIRIIIVRNNEPPGGVTIFVKTEEDNDESDGSWDEGCSSPDLSEGFPIPPEFSEEFAALGVTWLVAASGAAAARLMEIA